MTGSHIRINPSYYFWVNYARNFQYFDLFGVFGRNEELEMRDTALQVSVFCVLIGDFVYLIMCFSWLCVKKFD